MVDLRALQKAVYQNKIDKGFNVTDIYKEFCYTFGELSEAVEAYSKQKDNVGEELADVFIYLLGLSEILDIDLGAETLRKIEINKQRKYDVKNGIVRRIEE